MNGYLLDTNILSDIVRNPHGTAAERTWKEAGNVCASIVSAGELRYGLLKRPSPRLEADVGLVLASIPFLAWESPADEHYARLRVALEAKGQPIGANDMLIAAHALALDCILITDNEREFNRVPDLRVENWLR